MYYVGHNGTATVTLWYIVFKQILKGDNLFILILCKNISDLSLTMSVCKLPAAWYILYLHEDSVKSEDLCVARNYF
jgi:hypothetical protein